MTKTSKSKYRIKRGNKSRKARVIKVGDEPRVIEMGDGKKLTVTKRLSKLCEKVTPHSFQPFERELEMTPLYKNIKKIDNFDKKLVQRLNVPFTPSKITANNDFYTYINYRWLKDTAGKIGQEKKKNKYFVQIDDFRLVQNKVYVELIDQVKEYVKDHPSSPRARELGNVYKSLHELRTSTTKRHIDEFVDYFSDIIKGNNLWKLIADINRNEIINWGCPINWSMQSDQKDAKTFRNYIQFPQLSLYDYALYFQSFPDDDKQTILYKKVVKEKYLAYITKIFDSCLGKNHGLSADDVFQVEYDMVNAMGCTGIKQDDEHYYNIVKKEDALIYGFDWEQMTRFMGFDKTPQFFICNSLNFLSCMCKILNENWSSKKWMSYWYYIHLRQIIRFDKDKRYIYHDFNEKFLTGQPEIFPQDIFPIFGLSLTFNTLLTELYVEKNHNEEKINYVKTLGTDLLAVFKRIIHRNKWLSPPTKVNALKKLEHIDLIIAKPKEMRQDPLLKYEDDDAWGNMKKLALWKSDKYIHLNGKDVIDIPTFDWKVFKLMGTQSYIVNAFYTPTLNSIYIPLAILQKPFIDLGERGIEYNLAHIGYTLAHEMSHCLDEMGSKYDHNGNLHDWWTPHDKKKYKIIIKDIIKQYEVFAGYDGIKFDAEMSIGEDMADISGIAICQEYLRDFQMKNSDIVPIASLSFQAFFVYFAVQQRQHVYKEAIEAQLKTNPHPMDKYRTNIPLSRLELFRSLYNVKKGDKMWWPYTSTIWN